MSGCCWRSPCRGRPAAGRPARTGPGTARPALCPSARRSSRSPRTGPRSIGRTASWRTAIRLEAFYASESTVLRVLTAEGVHLPEHPPRRTRREAQAWPEWAELVPGVIWIYDFTHFRASKRCAVAVLDVVSRYWLATVVSAEESSRVEVAFARALVADGKNLLDQDLLEHLADGVGPDDDERVPVLLAVSDNGPQMTSRATAVFMAGARIAQRWAVHPERAHVQAWVESFFGHLKGEHPHLDKIADPGDLEAELDRLREHYNTVRLHEGIGYVTPDDEHHGRGEALQAARRAGLERARKDRLAARHPPGAGSAMTTASWSGITSANWCIFSDTPRSAPRRGLVRHHRTPSHPPRHLPLRTRVERQDPRLHRRLERPQTPLRLDQDRRRHPQESQPSNNFKHGPLVNSSRCRSIRSHMASSLPQQAQSHQSSWSCTSGNRGRTSPEPDQVIECPWPWQSPHWWPREVPAGGRVEVPTLCSCRP